MSVNRATASSKAAIGSPPLPKEHGAWVMLYAPLIIAQISARSFSLLPFLLLLTAVTSVFFARSAAALFARPKERSRGVFWVFAWSVLLGLCAISLLFLFKRYELAWIGLIGAALFCAHFSLQLLPNRKRLDRSQWGELLAVSALTLTAPAAYVTATGTLDQWSWFLWTACAAFFGSGVFVVEMMLAAAKAKGELTQEIKRRVGMPNVAYHLLLIGVVVWLALWIGNVSAVLVVVAYLPALVRAFLGTAKLSKQLPSLKRVGMVETLYALWFAVFVVAALLVKS